MKPVVKIYCAVPEMTYDILTSLTPYKPAMEDREAVEQVEIAIKYQGYIEHQQERKLKKQKTPTKNNSYPG